MPLHDILKCRVCGLTLENLAAGETAIPVCCGEPMQILPEQTAEYKFEKHVPYPETQPDGSTRVYVGQGNPHPMTEQHRIEWIEIQNGDYVNRKYLHPGEKPEADFYVPLTPGMIVREYCNMHGLWIFKVK